MINQKFLSVKPCVPVFPCWWIGTIRFFSAGSLLPFLCKLCEQIFFCFVLQHGDNVIHLYSVKFPSPKQRLSLLLRDSCYIEKSLSKCMRNHAILCMYLDSVFSMWRESLKDLSMRLSPMWRQQNLANALGIQKENWG